MSLVLEIDAFSGRPNPTVELDDDEAKDILEATSSAEASGTGPSPSLGV